MASLHYSHFAAGDPATALPVPVADLGDTLVTQKNNNWLMRLFYCLYYMMKG